MNVRPWACTTRGWAACRRHRLLPGPKVVQDVLRESGDAVGAGGELAREAVGRGANVELSEPSAGGGCRHRDDNDGVDIGGVLWL
jgi:hypothetical protein